MSPSGRFNHRLLYWTVWDRFYAGFFIWVELPVQRRLCPIFVRNVGSPDSHECFHGLTGSQQTPGFGASQILPTLVYFHPKGLILGGMLCMALRAYLADLGTV